MSKAIVLLGDLGSDHEGSPPTPVTGGAISCGGVTIGSGSVVIGE